MHCQQNVLLLLINNLSHYLEQRVSTLMSHLQANLVVRKCKKNSKSIKIIKCLECDLNSLQRYCYTECPKSFFCIKMHNNLFLYLKNYNSFYFSYNYCFFINIAYSLSVLLSLLVKCVLLIYEGRRN
jgi:hypothetical protein